MKTSSAETVPGCNGLTGWPQHSPMLGCKEWSQIKHDGLTNTSVLQHSGIEINATLDRFFEAINLGLLSSSTSKLWFLPNSSHLVMKIRLQQESDSSYLRHKPQTYITKEDTMVLKLPALIQCIYNFQPFIPVPFSGLPSKSWYRDHFILGQRETLHSCWFIVLLLP